MARILVVEDNVANLELVTYLLQRFGHTVTSAADGEGGFALLHREAPDLVVCDVQLPKMDGYEIVRRAKAHPALRGIPLIAVTALAMVGDRDRLLAAGFDGYIAKPIEPETFVAQVEAFVSSSPPLRPSRPPVEAKRKSAARLLPEARRATVLVVDNSQVNLQLAESMLRPLGYALLTASDVDSALCLARQQRPDLIVSDVHMPGQDGFDFIRALKQDPELCEIPFLFLSSTVLGDRDRERGLDLGAEGFILRPADPETVLERIEAVLSAAQRAPREKEG